MDKSVWIWLGAKNPSRWFRKAARWIFFGALIFAPWAYGGTTSESIVGINWLLGSALALWLVGWLFQARKGNIGVSDADCRWRPPRILAIASVAILILGWWMVFNAKAIFNSPYLAFVPLPHFGGGMPGSIDYALSVAWMVRGTLLLGVIWFVAELSRDLRWLLWLWWTVSLAGGSIAALGLLQKATGAEMIFWESASGHYPFFATYYYHANAGAYLNLVLPPMIGLAVRVFTRPSPPLVKAISITVALLGLIATIANTSRMGQLVTLMLMLSLVCGFAPMLYRSGRKIERKNVFLGVVVVACTLFAIAQASHFDQPFQRWTKSLGGQLDAEGRWVAYQVGWRAIGSTGYFGFGPGTFTAIFPFYTGELGEKIPGFWQFLHEDYLQTLMEWGWIGGALWALVFFGGIVVGIRNLRRQGQEHFPESGEWKWTPRQRLLLPLSVLALIGVAVHALVDFPLQIASIQLYAATFLGICWGSGQWGRKPETEKTG